MKARMHISQGLWSRFIRAAVELTDLSRRGNELARMRARTWRTDPGRGGLRFSERLRDIYRRRWLRIRR